MSPSPAAFLKGALRALLMPLARQRHLKRLARLCLGRIPALERRVRALVVCTAAPPMRRMHVPLDSHDLSPATQALYEELKRQFDTRKP